MFSDIRDVKLVTASSPEPINIIALILYLLARGHTNCSVNKSDNSGLFI